MRYQLLIFSGYLHELTAYVALAAVFPVRFLYPGNLGNSFYRLCHGGYIKFQYHAACGRQKLVGNETQTTCA